MTTADMSPIVEGFFIKYLVIANSRSTQEATLTAMMKISDHPVFEKEQIGSVPPPVGEGYNAVDLSSDGEQHGEAERKRHKDKVEEHCHGKLDA